MQYQITSDNISMSPSMDNLVKEKASALESKLSTMPQDACSLRAVLNKAPEDKFEVKLHLTVQGKEYFSDEIDYSLEHAIIEAIAELERMIKKDLSDSNDWEEVREEKWRLAEEQLETDPADLSEE